MGQFFCEKWVNFHCEKTELKQYQQDALVKEYLDQGVNLKKIILLFHGWELIEMKEVK